MTKESFTYKSFVTKPIERRLKTAILNRSFLMLGNLYCALCDMPEDYKATPTETVYALRWIYDKSIGGTGQEPFIDMVYAYRYLMLSPDKVKIMERINIPADGIQSILNEHNPAAYA